MTSREKAFVQITTLGQERVEYVDGRLGSGRILLSQLRETGIGRKEFNRIASIDDDWKDALFIASAAADGVKILYKGVEITAEQAHQYRATGRAPKVKDEQQPLNCFHVNPSLLDNLQVGTDPGIIGDMKAPRISVTGLIDDRVVMHATGEFEQLLDVVLMDKRFMGLQITVHSHCEGTVLFGPFLRVAHLFLDVPNIANLTDKFKLVMRELDLINRNRGWGEIGDPFMHMKKVLGTRLEELDNILNEVNAPYPPKVSEFGWGTLSTGGSKEQRLKLLDDIVSGQTKVRGIPNTGPVTLTVGVGPMVQLGAPQKDRLTKAAKRFNKQARKFTITQ